MAKKLPSALAQVPPEAPPLVGAALRAAGKMCDWEDTRRFEVLQRYFDGTQYELRPYNWDGSMRIASEAIGAAPPAMPGWRVPFERRRPPAVYRLGKIMVQRYTALVFGEEPFKLSCDEDPDTEAFVAGIVEATHLVDVAAEARDKGGTVGTAVISFAWVDGEPRLELHSRAQVVVLEWADEQKTIPLVVVKIWPADVPAIDEQGVLEMRETWYAREWSGARANPDGTSTKGADRLYRYVPETPRSQPRWELAAPPIPLDECPIVWIANESKESSRDGRGDFEGQEGMLDQLNLALCSTSGGTTRNADPSLVIPREPSENTGDPIRKGGHNVLWMGANAAATKYLEISGSSTTAGLMVADKLKAYALEDADVTLLDPEKMSGAAQSGEALRRLLFPMLKRAQKLRTRYETGIVRVVEGLVRQAQRLSASEPRTVFRLPPIVEKKVERDEKTGAQREVLVGKPKPRVPGKGTRLVLTWGPMLPPSASDTQLEVQTIQQANGQKPCISMRTGVERAARIFGVRDVDQELADILEAEEQMADATAGSFGARPGSVPEQPSGTAPNDDGDDEGAMGAKGEKAGKAETDDEDGARK